MEFKEVLRRTFKYVIEKADSVVGDDWYEIKNNVEINALKVNAAKCMSLLPYRNPNDYDRKLFEQDIIFLTNVGIVLENLIRVICQSLVISGANGQTLEEKIDEFVNSVSDIKELELKNIKVLCLKSPSDRLKSILWYLTNIIEMGYDVNYLKDNFESFLMMCSICSLEFGFDFFSLVEVITGGEIECKRDKQLVLKFD